MKLNVWSVAFLAALTLSCTREMPQSTSIPAQKSGMDAPEATYSLLDNPSIVPGAAIVYLSEDLSASLEAGASISTMGTKSPELGYLVSRVGVSSFKRLFPDAGEFEPRTRAEGLHRWYLVEYNRNVSLASAKPLLEAVPGILSVEPNRVYRQNVTINDPYWNQMWGQNNLSYPDYDVNCKPVWDNYTMGNPNVVVAVIDGGIQLDHPDLAANVAASGHYNYVRRNSTIVQHSHGTHVAGTIGAVNNNGTGVTGIAGGNAAAKKGGVTLLSLQVFETRDNGQDVTAPSFATAIKEAADKGAHISQNSWGNYFDFDDNGRIEGYEMDYARYYHQNPERSFTQAVDYFNKYAGCDNYGNQLPGSPMKGGVVIFAAGNEDIPYGSPGNYDGCISVGAINKNGTKANFSNYGDWVDICAPGVNIPSTYSSGQYRNLSGTSMACPHVSGVAALIASYYGGPGFTADELRARLLGGAVAIAPTTGAKPIGPLVNAEASFYMNGSSGAPESVSDVVLEATGHNIRVSFSATDAYAYMVLASTKESALQGVDYQNPASDIIYATKLTSASDVPGTPQSVVLAGLKPTTKYYVGVVAYSYDKKYSDLSPIVSLVTDENHSPELEVTNYPTGGFTFRHHDIVNLPIRVSDPDGDALSVTFDPRGSRAALESNNGSQELYIFKLMCPLVLEPGSFMAVVRAVDELGAGEVRTIQFKVLPNSAPVVLKDAPIVLMQEKDQETTLKLDEFFQDPDEEPLIFRASSNNKDVAVANVSEDGVLSIKAVSEGLCKVKISAEDHDGARVEAVVTVLMRPVGSPDISLEGDTVLSDGSITIIPGIEPDSATVRVISASGVVVYETVCTISAANPLELELKNLAPGIYTVEVTYRGQVYTYTIVKR